MSMTKLDEEELGNKIDDLQMQINGLKINVEQINKRISKLQDQKEDKKC